jgi:hypothetical protein
MLKFLQNIIQLSFSPQKGWEDLDQDDYRTDGRKGNIDVRNLYTRNFLPLILFCSLTAFVRIIFDGGPDFLTALQNVIIQFFSLFLSYHVAIYIFSLMMPKLFQDVNEKPDQRRAAIMVLYCISIIAVIFLLGNVIKVKLALIQFLPFYVIFIIWKGADFIGIPSNSIGPFMLMAFGSVLGAVYGLSFLFNILI